MQKRVRNRLGGALGIVAGMIFGLGLIAPLTPSEGSPPAGVWLAFAAFPLALACAGAKLAVSRDAKIVMAAEALVMLAASSLLLLLNSTLD